MDLYSTSGDLSSGTIKSASLVIHSISGEIKAQAVNATDTQLSSTSGGITVQAVSGDTSAHSLSGDVNLTFTQLPPRIKVDSLSGDVQLTLPQNALFTLDAHTMSGDVKSDFPVAISSSQGHQLVGKVGNGGNTISVHTLSGDIKVSHSTVDE
jgi:lia operon protein LiaG